MISDFEKNIPALLHQMNILWHVVTQESVATLNTRSVCISVIGRLVF